MPMAIGARMIEKSVQPRDIFFKKRRLGEDETASNHQAWAALGHEEKFTQAWEMVKQAHLIKGGNLDELRFQRPISRVVLTECPTGSLRKRRSTL
jgi:hypothetical protein